MKLQLDEIIYGKILIYFLTGKNFLVVKLFINKKQIKSAHHSKSNTFFTTLESNKIKIKSQYLYNQKLYEDGR